MSQAALRDILVFLQNRSWHDFLDILVVSFGLYRLLLLIRGTRAVQLVAGLAVLVAIGLMARVLQLQLTSWIFSNLAPALLIGIVILFQPELRRALDRMGRVGLLGRPLAHYSLQMMSRLVDEVVQGVSRLSDRRIGALLVFERDVGLENHALTGIRINGEVTSELVQTIFFPNSPLHDGAAIVRGNQVVSAGCLLPLVDDIPPRAGSRGRLGTRHRAALGLSLESDALVIVVSEETGAISIARDGNLRQGVDIETLRQVLHSTLIPRAAQQGIRLFGVGRKPPEERAPRIAVAQPVEVTQRVDVAEPVVSESPPEEPAPASPVASHPGSGS